MLTARNVFWFGVVGCGALFLLWASLGYPTEIQICEPTASGGKCEPQYVPVGIVRWILFQLDRYSVLLTAVFTAFIAWFTWTLRRSTDKLWLAGKEALLVAERPWVSVKLEVGSDLTYDANGDARITIIFILKNTGNSPALGVDVEAKLVPLLRHDKPGGAIAVEEVRDISDRVRAMPEGRGLSGFAIFPNDTMPYSVSLPLPRADIEDIFPGRGKIEAFSPYVVGCVSYRVAYQPGRHVTEFIANLRRLNASGIFKISDGVIPKLQMALIVPPFFGGAAD